MSFSSSKLSFTQLAQEIQYFCIKRYRSLLGLDYLASCRLCKGSLGNGFPERRRSWYSQPFQFVFIEFKLLEDHPNKLKNFWGGNSLQEHLDMVLKKLIKCRYKLGHWSVSDDSYLCSVTTFIMCANTARNNICLVTLMKMKYRMDIWR